MQHKCWWDGENHCIRWNLVGEVAPHEAEALMDELDRLSLTHETRGLIVDHTRSPKPVGRETRAVLERRAKLAPQRKMAFVGMNNLNRMIAQIIMSVLGQSKVTRFFDSIPEAQAWLRQL